MDRLVGAAPRMGPEPGQDRRPRQLRAPQVLHAPGHRQNLQRHARERGGPHRALPLLRLPLLHLRTSVLCGRVELFANSIHNCQVVLLRIRYLFK